MNESMAMDDDLVDLPVIRHTPAGPVCTTISISRIDYGRIKEMPADSSYGSWLLAPLSDERMEIRRHLL